MFLFADMRRMTVAVTHQVIVPGTCKSLAVMWHVCHEDFAPSQVECNVFAVVGEQTIGLRHHAIERRDIANVVSVNCVNGNIEFERRAQGVDADEITAMDDCLRTAGLRLYDCLHKWLRAVVAIGDDADLHTLFISWRLDALGKIHTFSVYSYIGGVRV